MYFDTAGFEAALEAEEWFEGKNADLVFIFLKYGYILGKNRDFKVVKKNILDSKFSVNKKCDLISIFKKIVDTVSVVRIMGGRMCLVGLGLVFLRVFSVLGIGEYCFYG